MQPEQFKRHCTVYGAAVGKDDSTDDDSAYDLLDVSGTPEEIGAAVAASLRDTDLTRGGKWGYLENGKPIYLRICVRIDPVTECTPNL